MDKKDFKLPLRKKLDGDLNRCYFLADSVFGALPLKRTAHSSLYNEIAEKAANITYDKYRYLLHLCYQKKAAILKIELANMDAVIKESLYSLNLEGIV